MDQKVEVALLKADVKILKQQQELSDVKIRGLIEEYDKLYARVFGGKK